VLGFRLKVSNFRNMPADTGPGQPGKPYVATVYGRYQFVGEKIVDLVDQVTYD
jgi:hypothetical protein